MTQFFKGDAKELQYYNSAAPVLNQTSEAKDQFLAGAYDSTPFLLMLYDEKRIPFSERINRIAFVEFIKEIYNRFPFIGTFDTYIFVLRAIFGELSEINFEVPAPGKLSIEVNATSSLEFEFIVTDENDEVYNLIDSDGDELIFRGVAGIETEYELELLFSEIMPAGIVPTINLTFFQRYDLMVSDEDDVLYNLVDHLGNQIVMKEIGV